MSTEPPTVEEVDELEERTVELVELELDELVGPGEFHDSAAPLVVEVVVVEPGAVVDAESALMTLAQRGSLACSASSHRPEVSPARP